MSIPTKLENYLVKLDKALGPIAISEKADIVTEIRSHVLEAQSRDESQTIESILSALGEPEQVANRYLMERGLKPQKAPAHPIVRWLVIGFLGTLGIFTLFVLIIIWKFTPIIKVDDKAGSVMILGGLIDIKSSDVKGASKRVKSDSSGSLILTDTKIKRVEVGYPNGDVVFVGTDKNELSWECSGTENSNDYLKKSAEKVEFSFNHSGEIDCTIAIPKGIELFVKAANSDIELSKLHSNTTVVIANGDVKITEDVKSKYSYKLSNVSGDIAKFDSSMDKDAYKIEVGLINGDISK